MSDNLKIGDKVRCDHAETCDYDGKCESRVLHQKREICDLTPMCLYQPEAKCLPVPPALGRIKEELQYIKDNPDAANIDGIAETVYKAVVDEALDHLGFLPMNFLRTGRKSMRQVESETTGTQG